jgi:methanogenic corrinoid protein MtbC1
MKERLIAAIADMKEDEALKLTQELVDSGEDPQMALDAGREAMVIVGQRFEEKMYFLPELLMAGEILKGLADIVKPKLKEASGGKINTIGKVVLGTVEGDIHDIGKNVVAFMLDVNGFEVHDVGIDAPIDKFVAKVKEVQPDILALSGFLTMAFDQMKKTVEAMAEANLKDNLKIMIGGAQMDDNIVSYIGADAYRPDATSAAKLAKEWIGGH